MSQTVYGYLITLIFISGYCRIVTRIIYMYICWKVHYFTCSELFYVMLQVTLQSVNNLNKRVLECSCIVIAVVRVHSSERLHKLCLHHVLNSYSTHLWQQDNCGRFSFHSFHSCHRQMDIQFINISYWYMKYIYKMW